MKTKRIVTAVIASLLSVAAFAKDFPLKDLPQAKKPTYDLSAVANKMSYYEFMHKSVGPSMVQLSTQEKAKVPYEQALRNGDGISVKLSDNNYNVHVNFPNAPTGGRSYGWTDGQVGDWSDAMYLDNVQKLVTTADKEELSKFYATVIEMLGACESKDIDSLKNQGQRVAANFLAIYSAEEFRSMVPSPHQNWDDALFEVTMLGAFHGGQSKMTKFYLGKFGAQAKEQGAGVYAKFKPGPSAAKAADKKEVEMNDYWQFSADPTSVQSGINITRGDFEKMGAAITKYESSVAKSAALAKVQAVVGEDGNVIKAISGFFAHGKSNDVKAIEPLSKDIADLMIEIYGDADKITAWEKAGEK
ncbi:MAG: hypothetical protein ACXVAX_03225 [Pseudobdellovibrio sp.]